MKKLRKHNSIPVILIAVIMAFTAVLQGCSSPSSTPVSTSASETSSTVSTPLPEAVVNWTYPGDINPDDKIVHDKVNEYMKSAINTTIDFAPISWGQYEEKTKIMIAAGDPFDIMFTCSWLGGNMYRTGGAKGAFTDLTPYFSTYLKKTYDNVPKKYWDTIKVEGKTYGTINYQIIASQGGYWFRKDMVDKYNLKDKILNAKYVSDLTPVYETILKNETSLYPTEIVPIHMKFNDSSRTFIELDNLIKYDMDDPSGTPLLFYETPEFMDYLKVAQEWYAKGILPKDLISVKNTSSLVKAGKLFSGYLGSCKPGCDVEFKNAYGFEIYYIKLGKPYSGSAEATLLSIGGKSKNADRAAMVIEEMNTNLKIYNTLAYGLEGVHYTKFNDGLIQLAPDVSKKYTASAWAIGNQFNAYIPYGMPADVWNLTKKMNEEAILPPLNGFAINYEPINGEKAKCDAIYAEMVSTINFGLDDPTATLNKLQSRMKAAGIDAIIAEVKKQAANFMSAKK